MSKKDFASRCKDLINVSFQVLNEFCPGGRLSGSEYEAASIYGGDGKSFKFNIASGSWADFAENGLKGGDIVSYVAAVKSFSQHDALEYLENRFLGTEPRHGKKEVDDLIFKLPLEDKNYPDFNHKNFGNPSAVYEYRNLKGQLCFFIARYETTKGKEIRPFSYTLDGKWISKFWSSGRPMFMGESLRDKKVVIVEGEKAAIAASRMLLDYDVVSWSGGSNAIDKTDFSGLKNKDVILWPDADRKRNKKTAMLYSYEEQPGPLAMTELAAKLSEICNSIKMLYVGIDEQRIDGWDAADALEEGWDQKKFEQLLENSQKSVQIVEENILSFPMVNKNSGKPLATVENFLELIRHYNITIRYNVITKEEEILIPGQEFIIDNRANASLAWIASLLSKHGFTTGSLIDFVSYLTGINPYNPVVEWITSIAWDGESRIQRLLDTIKITAGETEENTRRSEHLKDIFIKKWMTSAVAAIFDPEGISAHGVLVFQGKQNLGKTSWLKSLCPKTLNFVNDGVILRPDDKDSVKQAVSFWLIELGELDATFRKSDIAQLKAFLTKDKDVLRVAYARKESRFARRTVFFSSVNPKQFLQDPTGNRRFWTIECEEINYNHGLDMQQIWAEVYETLYKQGHSWVLSKKEIDLLNEHNEDFTATDPVTEDILEKLDWSKNEHYWEWITATEVLRRVGIHRITHREVMLVSSLIFKTNGGKKKKSCGLMKLLTPPLKSEYSNITIY